MPAVTNADDEPTATRLARVQRLHTELVQSLEWRLVERLDPEALSTELRPHAVSLCRARHADLSEDERAQLVEAVLAEIAGLGPLEPLMRDPEISDILVNNSCEVYVERRGLLSRVDVRFADEGHLLRIIQRVVSRVGRRVDETSPLVDARLPDGSRVHAVVPPLSLRGPTLSIRRFGVRPLTIQDLLRNGSLLPPMVTFLAAAIEARISFLISGGTGCGKTTLLNALSAFIPAGERLVTVEDAAELQLKHEHVISLETRHASAEGVGAVSVRELVRNSLRMRPDRIIVGEVRGVEAMDMLQAMNSGHEGSLSTIHANDVGDALSRLEIMLGMTGYNFSVPVMRQYVAAGIKLVVQLSRQKGGKRRVVRIAEIVGVKQDEYQLEEIFGFEQTGIDDHGQARGEFYATGYVPRCLRRIRAMGIDLPESEFLARRWDDDAFDQSEPEPIEATAAATGELVRT